MKKELTAQEAMAIMAQDANFEIAPCDMNYDFEDKSRFRKLDLTSAQKMQMSGLMQQLPNATSAATMAQAYVARFPEGLPHTLTALKQGGYGSMIRVDGKFAGSASFHAMTSQAAVLGAFTAMSAVTGQYFLAEINSRMDMMNQKLDKILEFLHSDKRAELVAELNFTKFAHQNYASIMGHEQQKLATIVSLQNAQKVALKDIEFYMDDLDSKVDDKAKKYSDLEVLANDTFRSRNCLELSLQLYVTASLLEVYFSENFDATYLANVEDTVGFYIGRCENRMIGAFNRLSAKVTEYKTARKLDKTPLIVPINDFLEKRNDGQEPPMKKAMHAVLSVATQKAEYYLSADGNIYTRAT